MTLAHRVDGPADARPLVLLGSVGSTTAMWDPVVGPLAEQFRVVRIDHRGHGSSPAAPAGTPATIADLAGEVLDVLDDLGLDRVDFAGLSLGGMVGMWLGAHRPERIARLALLCTSAYLTPTQGWLDRAATVRADGMGAVADAVVARWITLSLAERDDALVDTLRAMVTGIDAESYAQCCEAIAAMDQRDDLARIAAPTVVVAGADDPATPPAHGELIAEAIESARLHVLDGAAHVPTFERAGALTAVLLDHFRGGATLQRGFETRRGVLGDAHVDRALARADEKTLVFQEFLTRYAWGDIWTRPGLPRRDRSLVTLGALVALGAEDELRMHLRAALTNGVTVDELYELLMHCSIYAGMPRANRAVAIAREVFDDLPVQ